MNIISVNIGHNSGISILYNGRYHNLELEKLYKKRYLTMTTMTVNDFEDALIEVMSLIKNIWNIDNDFDICVLPNMNYSIEKYWEFLRITENIINAVKFSFQDHHHSHAACTFFQSPYKECLIFSYDGSGNDGVFNIYHAKDREISCIKKIQNSLGNKYREIALSIKDIDKKPEWGWQRATLSLPGKVMGLSAYGSIRDEWVEAFRDFYTFRDTDKLGRALGIDLISLERYHGYYKSRMNDNELLELPQVEGKDAYDLAKVNQFVFEEVFMGHALPIIEEYNWLPVCLCGGCSLNVLLNEKLREIIGNRIFIAPNADDSGISLGQLFLACPPEEKVENITYSGLPVLDIRKLPEFVEEYGAKPINIEELAKILKSGGIIGLLQGNIEVGPRALGNRSIICDPGFKNMKDKINRIKHREWFRPFAPVVRFEDVNTYFDFDFESPFMSFAPEVRVEWRDILTAITHSDGTSRPQTVRKSQHMFLYELLTAFEKESGYGVLLNTSFNIKGRPLLTTIEDAIEVLETTELDYVYLEGFLFKKKCGSD